MDVNQSPIVVSCNDGYIFNHDLLHQSGKVTCDYDLKKEEDNLWTKNDMSWYIHDDRLEAKCKEFTSQDTCEGSSDIPAPTYNPYSLIGGLDRSSSLYKKESVAMYGGKGVPIGCEWSPAMSDTDHGTSISKGGECHFRKKVDDSGKTEPLCKPVYCPSKDVRNSNRDGLGINKPLPGSISGFTEGECVDTDGNILTDITNAGDCICQQHRGCDTCTSDSNCQWCGGGSSPGCYYKQTNHDACDSNVVRQGVGGSCTSTDGWGNIKPGWSSLDSQNQTLSNCEGEHSCVNRYTTKEIPQSGIDLSLETISQNYVFNTQSPAPSGGGLCASYNNSWSTIGGSGASRDGGVCYFEKNIALEDPGYSYRSEAYDLPYIAVMDGHPSPSPAKHEISIEPYYCRPKGADVTPCSDKMSRTTCNAKAECDWVKNPLSDHILHWSKEGDYTDRVIISGCSLASPSPVKYNIIPGSDDNKVALQNMAGESAPIPHKIDRCKVQYIDRAGFSKNNAYNLDEDILSTLPGGTTQNDANPITCIDGYKYATPLEDGSCGTQNGILIPSKTVLLGTTEEQVCDLHDGVTYPAIMCYKSGEFITITEKDTNELYSLSGKALYNRGPDPDSECNNTGFTYTPVSQVPSPAYEFGTCSATKKGCELINKTYDGKDSVYWGKYCENNGVKVPFRVACEEAGHTWERTTDSEKCYGGDTEVDPLS